MPNTLTSRKESEGCQTHSRVDQRKTQFVHVLQQLLTIQLVQSDGVAGKHGSVGGGSQLGYSGTHADDYFDKNPGDEFEEEASKEDIKKFKTHENSGTIEIWENFQDMRLNEHAAARRGVCPVRRCGGRSVWPHQWTLPNSVGKKDLPRRGSSTLGGDNAEQGSVTGKGYHYSSEKLSSHPPTPTSSPTRPSVGLCAGLRSEDCGTEDIVRNEVDGAMNSRTR